MILKLLFISSLSNIAGTSLLACSSENDFGDLINHICLYKDEPNNSNKSNLISAVLNFSTAIYTELEKT